MSWFLIWCIAALFNIGSLTSQMTWQQSSTAVKITSCIMSACMGPIYSLLFIGNVVGSFKTWMQEGV